MGEGSALKFHGELGRGGKRHETRAKYGSTQSIKRGSQERYFCVSSIANWADRGAACRHKRERNSRREGKRSVNRFVDWLARNCGNGSRIGKRDPGLPWAAT